MPETNIVLDDAGREILRAKGFAHLATVGPSGFPQVSPTWYLWDDERGELLISLTQTRQKFRNLTRLPRAAVSITHPDQPYTYVEIRGAVTIEVDEEPRLIDALARKYLGKERYSRVQPGETRMVVRVKPQRIRSVYAG